MYIFFAGGIMIVVSATKFRNNLFDLLARVSKGETITIQRNGEDVAKLMPPKKENWQDKMSVKARLLVSSNEAFSPLEDIWEDDL
jgi:prevent-host-death family protein